MKQRPIRSDLELKGAAEHVSYEIEMLVYTREELGGSHASPESAPEGQRKDMALESFLLHFRNLRAFLCPPSSVREDDVIASDFKKEQQARSLGDWSRLGLEKDRLD